MYLGLLEVEVGFVLAVVSLLFSHLVLLCFAGRCLLPEGTELGSPFQGVPFRILHMGRVNCTTKVGREQPTVTRLRAPFPRGQLESRSRERLPGGQKTPDSNHIYEEGTLYISTGPESTVSWIRIPSFGARKGT